MFFLFPLCNLNIYLRLKLGIFSIFFLSYLILHLRSEVEAFLFVLSSDKFNLCVYVYVRACVCVFDVMDLMDTLYKQPYFVNSLLG